MSDTSTSINPNVNMTSTDTTVGGKLELNSASGAVTFDELEQLTLDDKKLKARKAKESKESGEESDKSKSKNEKSIDLTSDENKSSHAKSESKEASKEKSTDKESEQNKEASEAKLRKLIKAKLADKELELDDETLIPVKVNGVEEMWSLKDLRNDKAGKTAWDKEFTELSKQKKSNSAHELKLRQAADQVKEIFNEQDQDMKMYKLAKIAGVDPVQYREKFFNDNINLLEKWYSMSEDERKADALSYETKFHKHRADTLESSVKQEQSQRELAVKLDKLRASHQVSEDEFVSQYDQINKMVSSGEFDKSKVTPEFVIETIEKDRLWNAADSELQKLSLPWSTEQRGEQLLKFIDNAHHLKLQPQDMAEMVSEIWGQKKAQKKVQEISDDRREFLSGKKDVTQVRAKADAPMFFDDI